MKFFCSCCGRQAVNRMTNPTDKFVTTLILARRGFGNEVICGHCAKDLDKNGLFPEESSTL